MNVYIKLTVCAPSMFTITITLTKSDVLQGPPGAQGPSGFAGRSGRRVSNTVYLVAKGQHFLKTIIVFYPCLIDRFVV